MASTYRNAADNEWPAVGLVTEEDPLTGYVRLNCSGALIRTADANTRNVVLTAKHCGGKVNGFYLGTGVAHPTNLPLSDFRLMCSYGLARYNVSQVVPVGKGSSTASNFSMSFLPYDDVELLYLDEAPVGVDPLVIAQPQQNAVACLPSLCPRPFYPNATVVAFGDDRSCPRTDTYAAKHLYPVQLSRNWLYNDRLYYQLFPKESPNSTNCQGGGGDSGGPLIATVNGAGGDVIGIVTGSDLTGVIRSVYTRVDREPIYSLIETQLRAWATSPKSAEKPKTCASSKDAGAPGASPSDPSSLGIR